MKKRLLAVLAIVAIFVCGGLVGSPLMASAADSFWSGTIPATTTEALVVKVGETVLVNGYTFQGVNIKTGDTHVKTITVEVE